MAAATNAIPIDLPNIQAVKKWRRANTFRYLYFPETGPHRRELYKKQMEFLAAGGSHQPMDTCPRDCDGSPHRIRAIRGGNRSGKTLTCAYETTAHLIGEYPDWWTGKRFEKPISSWVASTSSKDTRDTAQETLLGPPGQIGSGMIPADCILDVTAKGGVPGAFETVYVKHSSGKHSIITFKSYDQGSDAFESAKRDLIWLDEEPPLEILVACVLRTMTVGGIVLVSFVPLQGMTELVRDFQSGYQDPPTGENPNGISS